MYNLTLQIYGGGVWKDAMTLSFDDPSKGFLGPCRFAYKAGYVLGAYPDSFSQGVSARLPVDFETFSLPEAPAFLHDIAPSGAAKRFLIAQLGRQKPEGLSDDLYLLGRSTPAPIGNLRIKESVAVLEEGEAMGFTRGDVITRDQHFLEYAYEQGAAIGGATGAGGEAPKLLMTQGVDGLLYPDAVLVDEQARGHWFIKLARNQALKNDQDILRSEYLYYRALQGLGIDTVATEDMALEQANKPSLWMKRFDRRITGQGVERLAVESIYSLAGVTLPGSRMDHLEVITLLSALWSQAGQEEEIPDLVAEYLRRDLINQILGNSDNHGRNTAIIRSQDGYRLAPIYDLAPMVMDAEGITRTTKWSKSIERAGIVNWRAACDSLADILDPQQAFERLRHDAQQLRALPDMLRDSGLPDTTFNHPAIALGKLDERLTTWGLQ
ncbi:type II toxin-antitoxin system HipA family toxin [Pseudomonas syringae group sp. J309-1]|uniref:type II toxin-antitoxin system HipA family toxin n=1 Tax=Pseudomonas syringae group sp. J309-1 TaxID=3079588 RepID=UPI00290E4707|nr:HipA domain-containing protein [Pseudomonas syringae group sp. J309-1]MDU8359917.1 HipA domain-containing protein [Pseudomonas syringae group sp. J309-1]